MSIGNQIFRGSQGEGRNSLALFMGPGLAAFFLLLGLPVAFCLALSFSNSSIATLAGGGAHLVGFDNYAKLLVDGGFWHALTRFLLFAGVTTVVELGLALGVAFYLDQILRVPKWIETALVLPMFVVPLVSGLVFRYLLDPSDGINHSFFALLGREAPDMLGSPSLTMVAILIQDIWRMWPFLFLIVYAGLKSLPREATEAACMDGAKRWQTCWYVLLPMMKDTIIVAVVLKIIESLKAFTEIYVMTGGGPGSSTELLSLYIVKQAFVFFKLGYATAASAVVLGFAAMFATALLLLQRRRWVRR